MLAFAIALWLDMPRPYWAMASVFITLHQLTGATVSKAVYRLLGTVIGATATIILIPNLIAAPEILSLAIALWVGICLYLSLIDGTPRSYVFMLAGYTVALLGFPILAVPQLTFDIVVARAQEIMLGILCAVVVAMLVLPRSVVSVITAQADAWLTGARQLGVDILGGRGSSGQRDKERMRLAAAASELDQLSRHLDYEGAASRHVALSLRYLRQHLLALLPLLAAIEDRRAELLSHKGMPRHMTAITARLANWLADGGRAGREAEALRAALRDAEPRLGADAAWCEIMVAGFAIRLGNLMDITRDCHLLREAISDGRDPDTLGLGLTANSLTVAVPHRDHGFALWAATATALSVLTCCAFWIATGWPDGALAPIFAAVLGTLLGGVDEPLPTFRKFFGMFLAVIAVTGIYTFGVLPRITNFEMVIVALMPAFMLFSWMAARPATALVGSFLAILTSVQLALDSSYSGDFTVFANTSVAFMLGAMLTGSISGIVRFSSADWIASRLLRSNWRTLAEVATRETKEDGFALASLMQHRLALLAARITVVPEDARSDAANLRHLRTALGIIDLRQARVGLSRHARAVVDLLLARLASAFGSHETGRLPDELVKRLDTTIAVTLQEDAGDARNEALIALSGIRLGLFPERSVYEPPTPAPAPRRMVA